MATCISNSNAHEVLGIANGKVNLRLGGEERSLIRLKAGDMLILPAGATGAWAAMIV